MPPPSTPSPTGTSQPQSSSSSTAAIHHDISNPEDHYRTLSPEELNALRAQYQQVPAPIPDSTPSGAGAGTGDSPRQSRFGIAQLPDSPSIPPSTTNALIPPAVPQIPAHPSLPNSGTFVNNTSGTASAGHSGFPGIENVDATTGDGPAIDRDGNVVVPTHLTIESLTDAQKARIVRMHLPSGLGGGEDPGSSGFSAISNTEGRRGQGHSGGQNEALGTTDEDQTLNDRQVERLANESAIDSEGGSQYHLPGFETTQPLYKWVSTSSGNHPGRVRSASFHSTTRRYSNTASHVPKHLLTSINNKNKHDFDNDRALDDHDGPTPLDPTFDINIVRQPQGFRRYFIMRKRMREGKKVEDERVTQSFVDFLSLYGHFGGEDLEEIEEDEDEEDEEEDDLESGLRRRRSGKGSPGSLIDSPDDGPSERSPLIGDRKRTIPGASRANSLGRKRQRSMSASHGHQGTATRGQAIMMLLKGFVGTGVLFLGKAFFNGGMLFSVVMLTFIALVSLYSFLLLVDVYHVIPASFGDMGGQLFGSWLRFAILFSIVISQLGFVTAYLIFIASNLQAFFMAVTNCKQLVPMLYLILACLVIFLPLAMVRNLTKLSSTALIADAFILVGLCYIWGNEVKSIVDVGVPDIVPFNPKGAALMVGTAIFSFEGIGLVIPIASSMKNPREFGPVMTGVMLCLIIIFGGSGALSYAAYGSDVQTVVLVNLPQDQKFVNVVQLLYSIAILLSSPLQLFPALRIMENGLFERSGKYSNKVKWEKNMFRFAIVIICGLVAWAGAADLDNVVSLIGSFACVPLSLCYPPLLHLKACASTKKQKALNIIIFGLGIAAMAFGAVQSVSAFLEPGPSPAPKFGKCTPPPLSPS